MDRLQEERLAITRLFIELSREVRVSVFGTHTVGDDMTGVLVACAVGIGTLEGRPMTSTKISLYVSLPRTTVLRKLERLCKINVVKKAGRTYVLAPAHRNFPDSRRDRYHKLILGTAGHLHKNNT